MGLRSPLRLARSLRLGRRLRRRRLPGSTRHKHRDAAWVDPGTALRLRLPGLGFHAASAVRSVPTGSLYATAFVRKPFYKSQGVKIQFPQRVNFRFLLTAATWKP